LGALFNILNINNKRLNKKNNASRMLETHLSSLYFFSFKQEKCMFNSNIRKKKTLDICKYSLRVSLPTTKFYAQCDGSTLAPWFDH
jgi:hypothetical protein